MSYVDSAPLPPVVGVVLPAIPAAADRVVFRRTLGRTCTNECFPSGYRGPATITVDFINSIVRLDFDETAATPSPRCSALFLPVSSMQLELDLLPAGKRTLQVDRKLSAFKILGSIAPHTVPFIVAPASGAPVPTGGYGSIVVLIAGALFVMTVALKRSPSAS